MDPPKLVAPVDGEKVEIPQFSEMSSINATALLRFKGDTLQQVLDTTQVLFDVYSPESTESVDLHGEKVPLAGNFTAAYGMWLAQSGFATQSLRTLFGLSEGIAGPHMYLMQPWDPNRRIIFMLHGLGSSPEAWVNVANEILGDPELRRHFQVWQGRSRSTATRSTRRSTTRCVILIRRAPRRHPRTWCSSATAWAACWRGCWPPIPAKSSGTSCWPTTT